LIWRSSSRFQGERERAIWLLVVACAAAALWAIAQVLGWPVAVRALLAVVGAVVALLVPEIRSRRAVATRRERLLHRVELSTADRRLPRVRDASLQQFRVHASRIDVPYIGRDQEAEVDAALSAGRPVLVVGHSMAGKTRLAANRVAHLFPDALLLAPLPGNALREFMDEGFQLDGAVVWLDDLDRYLSSDNWLDPGLLDRVVSAGAVVIATIRRHALELYRPTDKEHPPQWEAISRFSRVELLRRLSSDEQGRVEASIPDKVVRAAVERYGLAEYLGAGPEAVDTFDSGETEHPVGAALVRAAVDWRRAGVVRLVSLANLTAALPIYLAERHDVAIDEASIKLGMEWATVKINETVRLLSPRYSHSVPSRGAEATAPGGDGSDGLFEAFDYLVDVLTDRARSGDKTEREKATVPLEMWRLLAQVTTRAEQGGVQLAARSSFTGRSRVLADVSAWLAAPPTTPPQSLVITGAAGSGKTAVIRQLAFLADPAIRGLVPADSRTPLLNLPVVDLVITQLFTTRPTGTELMADIYEAAGIPRVHAQNQRSSMEDLRRILAVRNQPFTVFVDAVDETADPFATAQMLANLVMYAEGLPLRLLISTRKYPDILPILHGAEVIDLDDPQYMDSGDLVTFVRLKLLSATKIPGVNPQNIDQLAENIACRSEGSFLIARIMCDELVSRMLVPADFSDPAKALPGFDEIIRRKMAQLGPDEPDAHALLTALALGSDMGMTTDEWLPAASKLGRRNYGQNDLERLLPHIEELLSVADPNSPKLTYRFFHAAIRDYFVPRVPDDRY
jgi:hypothetical protein